VVSVGADDYRSLEYGKMVAVVVAAVKELHQQVLRWTDRTSQIEKNLNERLAKVETENQRLKAENQRQSQELDQIRAYLCTKDPGSGLCRAPASD